MPRLFRLKEWLTIEEAGRHLSAVYDEPVTEAEILQLALQGRLALSVRFVNHAHARVGPAVPLSEAKRYTIPLGPKDAKWVGLGDFDEGWITGIEGLSLGNGRVIELGKDTVTINDVWDLTMLGAERLDVEHLYQHLTGGPAVELQCLDGVLIRSGDNYGQLQEHFQNNEFFKAENLKEPWNHPSNWFPAGALPPDAVLVVRPSALDDLKAALLESEVNEPNGGDQQPPRPAGTGGRPMSALWPEWVAELAAVVHDEGIPIGAGCEGGDRLISIIADRLAERGLEGPTRTTVQATAKAVLRRLRNAGK